MLNSAGIKRNPEKSRTLKGCHSVLDTESRETKKTGFPLKDCGNDGKIRNSTLFMNSMMICLIASIFLIWSADLSEAADIKVIPSALRVSPGESFYIDINAENIPSEGLGAVQFRLNVAAQGSNVAGVSDISQGKATDVSVSAPLLIGPPTANRSGIGDFFLNATGPNGILVMDNEPLVNGSALYTFGHTNGSTPQSGSGSVARFNFAVGKDVTAERIVITLSDVMLLDTGVMYPLGTNTGATIELRCITKVPNLLGLSRADAQAALQEAGLLIGNIYEIDNQNKAYSLNQVLTQSYAAGTSVLCETPVDLAINTAPSEVGGASAADKPNDESGGVILSWTPSTSSDTAGYRVYLGMQLLTEIRNPSSTGTEISGLPIGQVSQVKITSFDSFGNESSGVTVSATAVDDVAPRITIDGVVEGAFYSSSVLPSINVIDSNLSTKEILLNGIAYAMAAIGIEGNYTLKVTATDSSGNTTNREIHFVIDKTPPLISVSGVEKGRYYNTDLNPVITVTDSNLQSITSTLNNSAFVSGSTIIDEGSYELKISASDKAGNSSTDTYTFYIDKTKPTSSITIGEPKLETGGNIFVSGSTLFTLSAGDGGTVSSGINKIEYRLNGSTWNLYALPFNLSGLADGVIAIDYRAIDIAGNIEDNHTLTVNADNTPPLTDITVSDPKFSSSGRLYVKGNTAFTLTATDALSGVSKTEYRIDGGQWLNYATFTLPSEGAHTIGFRSTDNLGNTETEKTIEVITDNTPPVSSVNIGAPQYSANGNTYIGGNTEITISASDAGSGIGRIEYSIDGSAFAIYGSAITLSAHTEGAHVITYRSIDNLGNTEGDKTLSVVLDNAPPSTSISIGEPKYIDSSGALYVTKDTVFTLEASDNLSGISVTEYKINTGEWTLYAPFKLNAEGAYTIYYRSKDNVGNIETEKVLATVIDNTPPLSELTIGAPKYVGQSGKTYATKDALFTIAAIDSASGVAKTEYRLDNGVWITYAPFSIPSEGEHTIEYRSTDNVGNVEAAKTFNVVIDNTPPVTEITLGEPKFTSSDGKLYVTGNTVFALASSDSLSGVSKTEYRIDNGQWQVYAPFTITSEGTHTIGFRSIDNLGNTETEKTLTIQVDNTSPLTNISVGDPKHQTGESLYISGSTEITISATDTGSGIRTTEYSIGSSSFITYVSPITFASYPEGSHTISYRSIDNLGNTEDTKTLIVTVDKTPPQTSITASDALIEGVINTVSPKTRFTLSSSDNLSGVKEISYKIDSGDWMPYIANFNLSGLAAGSHTITYKAMDNVLNEEIEKTITVKLIVIDVQKGLSSEPVVLAGVWTDENGSDIAQKQADMNNLNSVLSSLGLSYYMAPGNEEFVEAVRSGRYNTYLLVDYKEPLLGEEIRESVYFGSGLIFIKTSPQADPFLDDVFGVKFTGRTTNSGLPVNLVESPISAGGTINSSGKGVVSTIISDTAQSFGYVVDKRDTFDSIVSNQYGRGKTILYNFDLLYTTDQIQLSNLISNSLSYVKPIEQYPAALESIPLKISVDNSTEPVDIKLIETIPVGTSADSISPNASVTENTITWQKYLNIKEKASFRYYLNIPDASGDYKTDTELRYSNNGEYRLYGNYTLTFNLQNSSAELLRTIMSELSGLSANNTADADRITKAIADLSAISANASNRKDAEENIRLITNATDEIRKLSFDISDVRLKLNELLRIWEKKWYLME